MANIKTHLDNIKNAMFGKEVRGSIHDGIDAINKEVESTTGRQEHLEATFDELIINAGNSNAEIVDARVGENGQSFNKLGDRLDNFDSQLETKANEVEVVKKGYGTLNDFDEATRGLIQGMSPGEINAVLGHANVTLENLSFVDNLGNFFNKSSVLKGYQCGWQNGVPYEAPGWNCSDYIPIEPSTKYKKRTSTGMYKSHTSFYDSNKQFISGISGADDLSSNITTPSNAKFIRFGVTDENINSLVFFTEENFPVDYIPYTLKIRDDVLTIPYFILDKIEQIEDLSISSYNLVNPNSANLSIGYAVESSSGKLYSNEYTTSLMATDFIKINPATEYFRNEKRHLAFYDENKYYIGGIHQNDDVGHTFTVPSNANYIRLTLSQNQATNPFMLVEKINYTGSFIPYEPKIFIDGKSTEIVIPENVLQLGERLSIGSGINKFNKDANVLLNTAVSSSTGQTVTQSNIFTTDWIPCKENTYYTRGSTAHIAFYDSNKQFISGVNNSESQRTTLTPSGTCFLRACASMNDMNSYMIVEGETYPSDYYPYTETILFDDVPLNNESEIKLNGWTNKKWCSYGDSITASNGWQPSVTKALGFETHYLRGIGGTTFYEKGSIAWIDENGNYLARPDNGGTKPDGSIEIKSSFCNNERITKMIPTDVDLVVVMGGTNDFGISLGDLSYPYDESTFKGAVSSTIQKIQLHVPNATIVLMSPVNGRVGTDTNGNKIPAIAGNGLTTEDYAKAIEEVAHYLSIPYINMYGNCGINHLNRDLYIADSVHPNTDGYKKKMAPVVVGGLKLIEPLT